MKPRIKETDLAKPIIDYLESFHYDVYQEVSCGSGVADILGVMGKKIWIVELKKSLSIQLLEQAIKRLKWAHYVSICIPKPLSKSSIDSLLVNEILDNHGIGVLFVKTLDVSPPVFSIIVNRSPKLNRHVPERHLRDLLKSLDPRLKNNKAGCVAGERWTPFKGFCEEVTDLVRIHPGITPIEMAKIIKSKFYSTSKSAAHAAVYYARMGLVDGVEVRNEERRLHLYPSSKEEGKRNGMWG